MKRVVGKCGHCGGKVTVPDVWFGVIPPDPTCESCGWIKSDDLKVLKMRPPPKFSISTKGTG